MPDLVRAIPGALDRDEGGTAFTGRTVDIGLHDGLVDEVDSQVNFAARPFRTSSVGDALAQPDPLALLVPDIAGEGDAVLDLDGSRECIFDEEQSCPHTPVFFLFRGGDGAGALTQAPSLRSVTIGSDPDPLAETNS